MVFYFSNLSLSISIFIFFSSWTFLSESQRFILESVDQFYDFFILSSIKFYLCVSIISSAFPRKKFQIYIFKKLHNHNLSRWYKFFQEYSIYIPFYNGVSQNYLDLIT